METRINIPIKVESQAEFVFPRTSGSEITAKLLDEGNGELYGDSL